MQPAWVHTADNIDTAPAVLIKNAFLPVTGSTVETGSLLSSLTAANGVGDGLVDLLGESAGAASFGVADCAEQPPRQSAHAPAPAL
ncbi:MAG: hypothetical protein ABJA81_13440 [Nocardioidaceae bacterium]